MSDLSIKPIFATACADPLTEAVCFVTRHKHLLLLDASFAKEQQAVVGRGLAQIGSSLSRYDGPQDFCEAYAGLFSNVLETVVEIGMRAGFTRAAIDDAMGGEAKVEALAVAIPATPVDFRREALTRDLF